MVVDRLTHAIREFTSQATAVRVDDPKSKLLLFLERQYTDLMLEGLGLAALKGADRRNLQHLRLANSRLPPSSKVRFFLATATKEESRREKASVTYDNWYTEHGDVFLRALCNEGESNRVQIDLRQSFVNYKKELLQVIWEEGEYEEDYSTSETFSRSVLVLWPAINEIDRILSSAGVAGGVDIVKRNYRDFTAGETTAQEVVDACKSVFSYWEKHPPQLIEKFGSWRQTLGLWKKQDSPQLAFLKLLVEMELGNDTEDDIANLLCEFLGKVLVPLSRTKQLNQQMATLIAKTVKRCGWDRVRDYPVKIVKQVQAVQLCKKKEKSYTFGVHLLVELVRQGVDTTPVRSLVISDGIQPLQRFQSHIALVGYCYLLSLLHDEDLMNQITQELLLDKSVLKEPSDMSAFLNKLYSEIPHVTTTPFRQLITKQIETLEKILQQGIQFSWKMPKARIPNLEAEQFFHSDDQRLVLRGFNSLPEARKFADKYQGDKPEHSSIMTPSGKGREAVINIEKTRDYYNKQLVLLESYKKELRLRKSQISDIATEQPLRSSGNDENSSLSINTPTSEKRKLLIDRSFSSALAKRAKTDVVVID